MTTVKTHTTSLGKETSRIRQEIKASANSTTAAFSLIKTSLDDFLNASATKEDIDEINRQLGIIHEKLQSRTGCAEFSFPRLLSDRGSSFSSLASEIEQVGEILGSGITNFDPDELFADSDDKNVSTVPEQFALSSVSNQKDQTIQARGECHCSSRLCPCSNKKRIADEGFPNHSLSLRTTETTHLSSIDTGLLRSHLDAFDALQNWTGNMRESLCRVAIFCNSFVHNMPMTFVATRSALILICIFLGWWSFRSLRTNSQSTPVDRQFLHREGLVSLKYVSAYQDA